jgi:hypothetical protein
MARFAHVVVPAAGAAEPRCAELLQPRADHDGQGGIVPRLPVRSAGCITPPEICASGVELCQDPGARSQGCIVLDSVHTICISHAVPPATLIVRSVPPAEFDMYIDNRLVYHGFLRRAPAKPLVRLSPRSLSKRLHGLEACGWRS